MRDIEALRALSKAATPGPWTADSTEVYGPHNGIWVAETLNADDGADGANNAAFIAAAVNYVRALLAAAPAPTAPESVDEA